MRDSVGQAGREDLQVVETNDNQINKENTNAFPAKKIMF